VTETDECLLRLTPEQCQMLSDFIEKYKHEEKSEVTRRLAEDIQTTLQYFF